MKKKAHVRQRVPHFGALVKAKSANHAVAGSDAPQRFFKGSRLGGGAIENRDMRVRLGPHGIGNFAGYEFRLGVGVLRFEETDILPSALHCLECFPKPRAVVRDHARSSVENGLRRAVIIFQSDDLRSGEIFDESLHVPSARSAPAVDRLVLVSDDADILVFAREQPHQFFLRRVCVLKFIHLNISEPLVPLGAGIRMFPKDTSR